MSPPVPPSDQIVDNVEPPKTGPRIERRNKMVILNGLPLDFASRFRVQIGNLRERTYKVTFQQNSASGDARLEISCYVITPTDAHLAAMTAEAEKLLELALTKQGEVPARESSRRVRRALEDRLGL